MSTPTVRWSVNRNSPKEETEPFTVESVCTVLKSDLEDIYTSSTGGKKGTKKVRIDLIPPEVLEEVGLNLGIGAETYGETNWQKGYPYSLSLAALHRHLNAWHQGEQRDEAGFLHLAAVIFHASTLIYRDKHQPEWDDVHPKIEWLGEINTVRLLDEGTFTPPAECPPGTRYVQDRPGHYVLMAPCSPDPAAAAALDRSQEGKSRRKKARS